MKAYRDGWKQLPFKRPPKCDLSEGEKLFDTLEREVIKPTRRERDKNSWIWPGTWLLVDQRTSLRREGRLSQKEGRRLGRKIRAALNSLTANAVYLRHGRL